MVTHSEKVAKISSRIVEIFDGKVVRDEKKLDYQKAERKEGLLSFQVVNEDKNNVNTKPNKKRKEGHLSFFSALKLSFHNMWASKTKNILMAVGVSISLISLILMLSLGSGLTGYIDQLAQDYSNPNYVTISKSGLDRDGNELPDENGGNFMIPNMFTEPEIEEIKNEINGYLSEQGNAFQIVTTGEEPNLTFGFSSVTFSMGYISKVEQTDSSQGSQESQESTKQTSNRESIFFTYTTPPYYGQEQMIAGSLSGEGEIMLSSFLYLLYFCLLI